MVSGYILGEPKLSRAGGMLELRRVITRISKITVQSGVQFGFMSTQSRVIGDESLN